MKILILHHYALPPGGSGGTRHFTFARWLVQRGHDVTILASRHAYTGAGTVSENAEDVIEGVRFVWSDAGGRGKGLGGRAFGMIGFARDAYRKAVALSRSGERWDVVLGTSPQPFAAVAAAQVARKLQCPFVLEIRDLWPMSVRDLAGWGDYHPGWLVLRRVETFLYRRADHIMTLLPGSQDWIAQSGGDRDCITVVPNGVDASGSAAVQSVRTDGAPFTCIYAGAHGVANGLDTVVRAAALLPELPGGGDIRVRLVGSGPTKPRLQALAEELDAKALEFRDPVPKSQIPAELAAADACILHLCRMPTFEYGVSPNKLFDYLLAGRPVLYAVEASNDPVGEAGAGISIVSEDPRALAEAMLELSKMSPEMLEQMGERGKAYVREHHDWEVLSQHVERIMERVVKLR